MPQRAAWDALTHLWGRRPALPQPQQQSWGAQMLQRCAAPSPLHLCQTLPHAQPALRVSEQGMEAQSLLPALEIV